MGIIQTSVHLVWLSDVKEIKIYVLYSILPWPLGTQYYAQLSSPDHVHFKEAGLYMFSVDSWT